MSKQGNYVTIPGVDPNWAKGISSALSDLSRSYNQRASEEAAAAERLAANEESKRRWEAEQERMAAKDAYQMQRDVLADARAQEQQQIDVWRYNNQETRAAAAEERAADEAKRKADEFARLQHNRNVEGSLDVGFGVEDLGPNVQQRIATGREQLDAKRNEIETNIAAINERRNFLTPEGGFSKAGQAEYDARLASYMEMYNDPAKAAEMAKADILTMRDNAVANNYETTARAELDRVQTLFDNQLSRLPMSGTVEEYIDAGIAAARAAGHKDPNSEELRKKLRGEAIDKGLKTRADIIAAGQAAAETAYSRRKDEIGFLKDFYSARTAAGKASGKSTGMSSSEFTTAINSLDMFGDDEKKQAVSLFTTLANAETAKDIPASILREAIILTSANNVLGENNTLDPTNPEDLAKVVEVAEALNKGSYTGQDYIKRSDFAIGDIPSYSADQLMGRRFDLTISDNFPTPRSVLARPDVAAFKEQQAAEQQAKEAQVVLDEARKAPLPVDGTINTAKLKELLGDRLDLSPPSAGNFDQTDPESFAIPQYSPQQMASRELLEVQQNIDKWRQQKAGFAAGGDSTGAAQRQRQKWIDEATARRQELYNQLMGR